MGSIWNALLEGLEAVLRAFHTVTEPVFGQFAWGWAIILLTFAVRLFLLPLAVKQTRSMRAMQELAPQIKRIQKKYKVDRSMLRTDPDKYKEARAKQQEETMKLYKEHQVNPASGCLPLLLQMPIFFALFRVLQGDQLAGSLAEAPWYGIKSLESLPSQGLAAVGIGGYLLIALMLVTTFVSQRQTMARNPNAEQNQQQKILLYVMPVMLAFFSFNLPIGVLIYWVATNAWTMVQQWIIFRNVQPAAAAAAPPPGSRPRSRGGSATGKSSGSTNGKVGGDGTGGSKRPASRAKRDKEARGAKGDESARGGKGARRSDDGRSNGRNRSGEDGQRRKSSPAAGSNNGSPNGSGTRSGSRKRRDRPNDPTDPAESRDRA